MPNATTSRRRQGWIAGILTIVTPGLGHLYAGAPAMGALAFTAAILALDAAIAVGAYAPLGVFNLFLLFAIPIAAIAIAARHAVHTARRSDEDYKLRPYNRWYVYVAIILLAAFVAQPIDSGLVRAYLAQAYRIPSTAMAPTILVDDYLYVRNFLRPPQAVRRGQIVVFASLTDSGVMVMKRVTGVPADTLQMRRDTLLVDGVPQVEPFTQHIDPSGDVADSMMQWQAAYVTAAVDRARYVPTRSNWGPIVVPPGSYFVLGDNRDNSFDSRYYGFVPRDRVRGRPLRLYYSFDPDAPRPLRWLTAVRWHRIGEPVR